MHLEGRGWLTQYLLWLGTCWKDHPIISTMGTRSINIAYESMNSFLFLIAGMLVVNCADCIIVDIKFYLDH